MKRNLYVLLSLLVLASLTLAACGAPQPATEGPVETDAPATEPPATEPATAAPTEAPVEPTPVPDVPIATFDGTILSVPAEECNGEYAGLFQSIEATDQYTVTFNLCRPDPAFLSKISLDSAGRRESGTSGAAAAARAR